MTVKFSKYIYFLWFFFSRSVETLSKDKNRTLIKTSLKELTLESNKKIKFNFLLIKYLPVLIIILSIVTFREIKNLDIIILIAPFYLLILYIFPKYLKILVPILILSAIFIFIFYNLLLFPLFIKYFLVSYVFVEFYLDILCKDQYYVYEKNKKEIVAFAVIKKRS